MLKASNLWKVQGHAKTESSEVERVKSLFRKYDANGDGVIDQNEFKRFMQALGLQPSCLGEFMRHVDRDGDGAIQYEEFVDWVLSDDPMTIPPSAGIEAEGEEQPDVLAASSFNAGDAVDDSGSDDDDGLEARDLTTDEVADLCGGLPYGWPENGIKIVNNMRRRFPDFPCSGSSPS